MKKPIVGMPSSLRILASVPAEKIWGLTFDVKAVNVAWQQNPNHLSNHHHNNLEHQGCQRILATKLWKRLWFQDVMVLMFICDDNLNIASYCFVCFHLQTIFLESGTEGRIPRVFLTHLKIYSIKGELYFHYFWHCVDSDRKQLFFCDFIPITLVSFMTNANIKMGKRWVR